MATVYILYSVKLDKFYVGSCLDLHVRLNEHSERKFKDGFTSKTDDWELFLTIDNLEYKQARGMEQHIKRMKSGKYIENLRNYKDLVGKLIEQYKIDNK